jgi:hypothetical protein
MRLPFDRLVAGERYALSMSIDPTLIPPPEPVPDKPPSKLVWTIVFLGLTIAGMIVVLVLWPNSEPTRTTWFWICVGFYPAAIAAFIALHPFSTYFDSVLDAQAWNTVRDRHEKRVFKRASEPLVLLKGCCRYAVETTENPASRIIDGTLALASQASIARTGNIRARWLTLPGVDMFKGPLESDVARQHLLLEWLFDQCIDDLEQAVQALPVKVPLSIHLSVTGDGMSDLIISNAWDISWSARELRRAEVTIVAKPLSVTTLREWLNAKDKASQQQARLIVHIQLRKVLSENPPPDSAEMAVAVLFVRREAAARHGLTADALIHQPISGGIESLHEALTFALRCGQSLPAAIRHVWHTGFDTNSSLKLFDAIKLAGIVTSHDPKGQHDIDQSIGHAGDAAGWAAVVCAADLALSTATPQLVAQTQGNDTWLEIIAPPSSPSLDKPV